MLDLSYYMFFIIASKYYNKKDVVNFVVTSIKHYFHISCLSPWRLLVGQVNHNYLHQYKHYWWVYTQTWRQGLSSIYSGGQNCSNFFYFWKESPISLEIKYSKYQINYVIYYDIMSNIWHNHDIICLYIAVKPYVTKL